MVPAVDVDRADVILIGAGLANSLIALRLKAARPGLRVVVLEARPAADPAPHTWSLFATDVAPETWAWLAPLAACRWADYDVRFPAHARRLSTSYACLTGDDLAGAVARRLGPDLRFGAAVMEVAAERVACADGSVLAAPLVIDGRGARPSPHLTLAWQKFLGLELALQAPHGRTRPMLMDARVPQRDGFRFVYVLPLAADRLLVEDTRYSAGPGLDAADLRQEVLAYAAAQGWAVRASVREETGVLPIVLDGDFEAYLAETPAGLPQSGLRAGLFHPVTGYSLPQAAALADAVAALAVLDSRAVHLVAQARARRLWREGAFLRTLNRMLFVAAEPDRRYRVLERFYRLPQPLIERFYAGRLTLADKARILAGRPPVPLRRALAALPPHAARR